MPPKANPVVTPSKSSSLVPFGPRAVASERKNHGIRDENGEKPTTARAMVLRNGKYGARGTGEMILVSKLSGREKLDLLAEDLVEQSKTAIMAPFRLEECLRIAESQCHAFLDDITNLRDPQLFMHLIQAELNARTKKDKTKSDPLKNASYVASAVATRIHNAYMLASAWKLVSQTLAQLALDGVTDTSIKSQLNNNASIRTRYMALYELVNELVEISQSKFSVLATTTPHYARYFKVAPDQADVPEPEMMFDWQELREACLSFMDSIIIEICFPKPPYPKDILYQILRDAVAESPKEAKRFPQELWDAVGDLSISIQLQQLLEAPLAGSDGDAWKLEPREMPTDYERWGFAQFRSREASEKYANFKDLIFPLEKTKMKTVLDNMWKYINLNYKAISGEDIDTLWDLTAEFNVTPQWHAFYMPNLVDSDSEYGSKPSPAGLKGKKNPPKRLAITSGPADDSDDSMPELQSVSNSSDEIDSDSSEESDEEDDEGSDSDETGYDTEEEDELREMLREAMDTAHEADWLHSAQVGQAAEIDPFEQNDRKALGFFARHVIRTFINYCQKFMMHLGRLFSSSPKLRSTIRTVPTAGKVGRTPSTTPVAAPKTTPAEHKSYKVTVEDVEDEDEVTQVKKKKKKKPKKKKKKTTTPADANEEEVEDDVGPSSIIAPASPAPPLAKAPIIVAPKSTTTPPVAKKAAPKMVPRTQASTFMGSTSSLPLSTETVAQSARSYLQAKNLNGQKSKVKSRPNHATGFFSRILCRVKGEPEERPQKGAKHSWFIKLSKKSKGLMHQLLNTAEDDMKGIAPMKWENFLRLMREMGFEYDPSTAGSSVRFDPPDKGDPVNGLIPAHPDPTLQPIKLKQFAKRLKKSYGWTEEDFIRQTEA
ncbi:hypothetical protein C0995_007793 [Termitomyces sp. Mi166|nr:hypothetical protein C0995_007793 [Termitomyces sp. Mi166\